jgi:hypothetical protein
MAVDNRRTMTIEHILHQVANLPRLFSASMLNRIFGTHRWLNLRVQFTGSHFKVFYDGKQLFEVEDSTFSVAGKVGLWTKADSVTLFDEIIYGDAK